MIQASPVGSRHALLSPFDARLPDVGQEGVCKLGQLGFAQLRRGPSTEACVLDETVIHRYVVPLDVMGEVRVPEPLTIREQEKAIYQLVRRAENVIDG